MSYSHIDSRACDAVQRIRIRMDMSYDALGAILHVSESTACNICNGQSNATPDRLGLLFAMLVRHPNKSARTLALGLLRLVTGDVPIVHHFLDDVEVADLSDPAAFAALVTAQRETNEEFRAALALLEDGIDPADPGEAERLRTVQRAVRQAIDAQYRLMAGFERAYESRAQTLRRGKVT